MRKIQKKGTKEKLKRSIAVFAAITPLLSGCGEGGVTIVPKERDNGPGVSEGGNSGQEVPVVSEGRDTGQGVSEGGNNEEECAVVSEYIYMIDKPFNISTNCEETTNGKRCNLGIDEAIVTGGKAFVFRYPGSSVDPELGERFDFAWLTFFEPRENTNVDVGQNPCNMWLPKSAEGVEWETTKAISVEGSRFLVTALNINFSGVSTLSSENIARSQNMAFPQDYETEIEIKFLGRPPGTFIERVDNGEIYGCSGGTPVECTSTESSKHCNIVLFEGDTVEMDGIEFRFKQLGWSNMMSRSMVQIYDGNNSCDYSPLWLFDNVHLGDRATRTYEGADSYNYNLEIIGIPSREEAVVEITRVAKIEKEE